MHTQCARAAPHAAPHALEQAPTRDGSVVLGDLASAIFFNLLALLWLRATRAEESAGARRSDEHKTSREVIEVEFVTGACSFVVGWGYIVFCAPRRALTYTLATPNPNLL